jgi:predicted nuclease with TOPRIM domain
MTNIQLYFAIGIPSLMVLIGVLVNAFTANQLGQQLGARITSLENTVNSRIGSLETRIGSLESRFDILTGKVADLDTRLSLIEDRLKR